MPSGESWLDWEQPARTRVDQSGSGSATAPSQKKWPCLDGTIEFHLGIGPATGRFMRWMVDEGAAPPELLDIDWLTLPRRMRDAPSRAKDMV